MGEVGGGGGNEGGDGREVSGNQKKKSRIPGNKSLVEKPKRKKKSRIPGNRSRECGCFELSNKHAIKRRKAEFLAIGQENVAA